MEPHGRPAWWPHVVEPAGQLGDLTASPTFLHASIRRAERLCHTRPGTFLDAPLKDDPTIQLDRALLLIPVQRVPLKEGLRAARGVKHHRDVLGHNIMFPGDILANTKTVLRFTKTSETYLWEVVRTARWAERVGPGALGPWSPTHPAPPGRALMCST